MTPRRMTSSRGFTLIELMFGVIFTCMTLGALTALLLAVSSNWSESRDSAFLPAYNATSAADSAALPERYAANQRFDYIDALVKNAKYLGWADKMKNSSNSAVILWASDNTSAGTMQVSEVRLIEFDANAHTLTMWYVPAGQSNSNGKAPLTLKCNDIDGPNDVALFKQSENIQSQVLLRNVVEFAPKVVLNPADPYARPALEYVLKIKQGEQVISRYQTACLRAPATQPT